MDKYKRLGDYLTALTSESWTAKFSEIEEIVGDRLPASAHNCSAWWSNEIDIENVQARGWLDAGWQVLAIDLVGRRVVFERCEDESSSGEPGVESGKHWDTTPELLSELRLTWEWLGNITLVDGKLTFPEESPDKAGLYRMRIRSDDASERLYVGESSNLKNRFNGYRNPGPSQTTNIRVNALLVETLKSGAEVSLSIARENVWLVRAGKPEQADLSSQTVRRLFENFVLVVDGDEAVESLNL